MIFYYAAGGGLGHLTRMRAVIHTLGVTEPLAVLTASPFAIDKRVVGDTKTINIPQNFSSDVKAYKAWLHSVFAESLPTKVFLDTFPCGILGEFCDFDFPKSLELFHVARGLRWSEYSRLIKGTRPVFKATYLVEPLAEEQAEYLENHSQGVRFLELADPPSRLTQAEQDFIESFREGFCSDLRPRWFIIHSGSFNEISELLAYAKAMSEQEQTSPRLILIAPEKIELSDLENINGLETPDARRPISIEQYDFYPASELFPFADRIITACGFNAMRETEGFKDKHRFIPFARRFDNQFLRAARRRAGK